MIPFVIAISCLSLVFAVFLARHVIQRDAGTAQMQQISNAIKEGAEAFLSRQNRTIISLSVVLAALIFVLYAFVRTPNPADPVPPVQLAFLDNSVLHSWRGLLRNRGLRRHVGFDSFQYSHCLRCSLQPE